MTKLATLDAKFSGEIRLSLRSVKIAPDLCKPLPGLCMSGISYFPRLHTLTHTHTHAQKFSHYYSEVGSYGSKFSAAEEKNSL